MGFSLLFGWGSLMRHAPRTWAVSCEAPLLNHKSLLLRLNP